MKRLCSVEGCERTHDAKGYCRRHYGRWVQYGDPLGGYVKKSLDERFWPKVQRGTGDECWPWLAGLTRAGYGQITRYPDGLPTVAHKVAYEMLVGPVPEGMTLDHLCHTNDPSCTAGSACLHRRCVNPYHLEVVTLAENLGRAHRVQQSHCKRGHPYGENDENRYASSRNCKICMDELRRQVA